MPEISIHGLRFSYPALEPGGEPLTFEYENQRLLFEVPADKVGLHRIIEVLRTE